VLRVSVASPGSTLPLVAIAVIVFLFLAGEITAA
jgi:hypothetical protein